MTRRRAEGFGIKNLQNLDSIRLVQETEHALIDSSVRKGYEYYNSS